MRLLPGTSRLLAPVGWALAVPGVVLEAAASTVRAAAAVQAAAESAAQTLPALTLATERAERVLSVVEGPALRLAAELDDEVIDDFVRTAKSAPAVVASMVEAVAGFAVFVDRAEAVRAHAEQVAGQTEVLVASVQDVVTRISEVTEVAETALGRARQLTATADDLARQARPVVELAAELGEQAAGPARTLVGAASAQAPNVAELAPGLVSALGDLTERLPGLLRRLDQDVLPMLRTLERTPGDVLALRESVDDIEPLLGEVEAELAGLPGAKLLRRRGRRSDASEDGPDS